MPGFLTHYTFGIKALNNLSENYVKKSIKKNQEVYNLGLQGPDIFFYFIPYKIINKNNLGSLLHRNKVKDFFVKVVNNIIECNDDEEREILTAYVSGFYGHYSLDKKCHPYIYYKSGYMYISKNYHEKHVMLESDIDYLYSRRYFGGKNIDFNYRKLVALNNKQRKVISNLLYETCNEIFDNIILNKKVAELTIINFEYLINFLNDKTGKKYKFLNGIERRITKCENLSSLFNGNYYKIHYTDPMNESKRMWFNPWKEEERKEYSFYELSEFAELELKEFIKILDLCLKEGKEEKIKKYVKNCSYINGLEIK